MRRWLLTGSLLLCAALTSTCETKPAPLFSKGVYPIVFTNKDFPLHPKTGVAMQTSADCASCHKTVYDNWLKSRHRVALTNELYRESHEREPSPWCVNCHAPLRLSGAEKTPYKGEEGISCLVCHAREGKIMTGALPAQTTAPLAHTYTIRPEFKDERMCENCHDFNFPTAATAMSEGKHFRYTQQPMQSTIEEYRSSGYSGRVTCQNCHLFSGTAESHSFPGGHALERLKNDLKLDIERGDVGHITVRLSAHGIGHAFPTGDLFRTLRVRLSDSAGKHATELELRHYFEAVPMAERGPDAPLKYRVREEILPPPKLDYVSMREYVLAWPKTSTSVTAELYMDYLDRINTLTTHLPARITRPLIYRKKFRIDERKGDDTKG
jgi:Cytochrome c554 and c-prime